MASIIKSDNGVSSGVTGIVQIADSSGQLSLQTTTISGTATTAVTIDNTQVATFANTLKAPNLQGPAFSAYQSAAQTLTLNTQTKVQLQTKEFDTANAFDNATNYRFTPTVAGYYQVDGCIGTGNLTLIISYVYKNGTEYKRGSSINSGYQSNVSCLVFLNGTTDYVELYGLFGATQAITAILNTTYFQATMVRSA